MKPYRPCHPFLRVLRRIFWAIFALTSVFAADEQKPLYSISPDLWGEFNYIKEVVRSTDSLNGTICGSPAYMFSKHQPPIEADKVRRIVFKMRAGKAPLGQLFWITDVNPAYNDKMHAEFRLESDGEMHEYELVMAKYPSWTGKVIGLRIGTGPNAQAEGSVFEVTTLQLLATD